MITVDEKGKNTGFFLHTAGLIEVKTVVNFFSANCFYNCLLTNKYSYFT